MNSAGEVREPSSQKEGLNLPGSTVPQPDTQQEKDSEDRCTACSAESRAESIFPEVIAVSCFLLPPQIVLEVPACSYHKVHQVPDLTSACDPHSRREQTPNVNPLLETCSFSTPVIKSQTCMRSTLSAWLALFLKLIWKPTAKSVHVFIKTLHTEIGDSYSALCQALGEEYSALRGQDSAAFHASQVLRGEPENTASG